MASDLEGKPLALAQNPPHGVFAWPTSTGAPVVGKTAHRGLELR